MQDQQNYLERSTNPFFGEFQFSNIEEATVTKIHSDEANNVTLTADVVTIKNSLKTRVPFLLPYASVDGRAGIFAVPDIGDRCLIGYIAGNQNYILGFHSPVQLSEGRPSAAAKSQGSAGPQQKGSFAFRSQLLPGAIELRTKAGNRIMMHPGGPIAIDARKDLFTLYDTTTRTITSLTRSHRLRTAGGSSEWVEGLEKSKTSQSYIAEMFTKSATRENLEAGDKRGGARLRVLFNEDANHFIQNVCDEDVNNTLSMGPNGLTLVSADLNSNTQTLILLAPSGNFELSAGDPNGANVALTLAPTAIAISAKVGNTQLATVLAETNGKVTITSNTETIVNSTAQVNVQAPSVTVTSANFKSVGGLTALAGGGAGVGLARARVSDTVTFVTGGSSSGSHQGMIIQGSTQVTAGN